MAEVYYPGGSNDIGQSVAAYLSRSGRSANNDALDLGDPSLLSFVPAQGAIVSPLNNLISIEIDPEWWARFGLLWKSPLRNRISVSFMENEQITERAEVRYADNEVIGRAESYKSWMGTGNRELTLPLRFRVQGLTGVDLWASLRNEVSDPAKWLEALKYGINDNGVVYPPPPVIIVIGQLIVMRAVATAIELTWLPPWDPTTGLAHAANVECTFTGTHLELGNFEFNGATRFEAFKPLLDAGSTDIGSAPGRSNVG